MLCIAIVVWFSALIASARTAEASCTIDDQGPCYRYWHAERVLLGEIKDKVLLTKQLGGDNFQLRIAVIEGFRGVSPAESLVTINAYDGECGLNGRVGDRILFYADREKDGAFWASIYSMPVEISDADLVYARLASKNAAAAMVYGEVDHRDDRVRDAGAFTSLAGVTVRVRGKGFDVKTTTDVEGNYSIRLPGTGRYEVEVTAPDGTAHRMSGPTRFELTNAQECFHVGFQLLTNGRIGGVVIDERSGRPVPNLVLGAGNDGQQSRTDRSGVFDIGPLSAGEYRLRTATGGDGVTVVPGTVTVSSGKPTVVRPLVARFARPLVSVTFDLKNLPGDGWISMDPLALGLEIGQQKEVTIALEHGASLDIYWATSKETKKATFTVDEAVSRVKLSQLKWRPVPWAAAIRVP